MQNLISVTVHMDLNLKRRFERFFKLRGMSFEHALNFQMHDFLAKYKAHVLEERMDEYKLSNREKEVAEKICEGRLIKEIASKLFVSIHTVRNHIRHIYEKCEVQNRVELLNKLKYD